MILDDLLDLEEYWEEHPPLHILFQAFLEGMSGKKVGTEPKGSVPKHTTAEELISVIGPPK